MNSRIAELEFDSSLLARSAERIARECSHLPQVAIVAGSGIAAAFEDVPIAACIPYSELPCMPQASVAGHRSEAIVARIAGETVLVFAGRFHVYEGYSPSQIAAPIALAAELGIRAVIATNAAGGLHWRLHAGDLLLADSIVNMTFRSLAATSRGRRLELRTAWRERTLRAAVERGVSVQEGTYVAVHGPSYETPAEVRFFRLVGECIGMSTVHEVEAATYFGIEPLVVSVITNTLADVPRPQPLSHDEVLATSRRASSHLGNVIEAAITTFTRNEH
ncbi:MAG: purine-nucleoside phosphorylase [Chlorobi bacterium]|nr:purine-nucleoside phosphorylase [Chlorobiota bacterium]